MRNAALILAAALVLTACSKGDDQADALDRAAGQADPAAAEVMRNEADQIRDGASDANLADPKSPAQGAMAEAGAAASNSAAPDDHFVGEHMLSNAMHTAPVRQSGAANSPGAQPHRAGEPVPR